VSEPPIRSAPEPAKGPAGPETPPAASQPETTQPFLLAKKPAPAPAPQPSMRPSERVRAETPAEVARMARRLGVVLIVNAALYAGVAASGALRYHRDRSAIPEVVLAIVAAGLALWGALAGHHLWRAGAGGRDAGHELAGAFSNLRSIFVLKGTGLFLVLALACFAFSALFSLAALL
jgi:hypothetical protein